MSRSGWDCLMSWHRCLDQPIGGGCRGLSNERAAGRQVERGGTGFHHLPSLGGNRRQREYIPWGKFLSESGQMICFTYRSPLCSIVVTRLVVFKCKHRRGTSGHGPLVDEKIMWGLVC